MRIYSAHSELSFQPALPDDTPILPGLSPVDGLSIHAKFDGGAMSSNGGALLLREAGRVRKLSTLLASCIADARDPTRVVYSYASMIQARMVAIACGHEDCDDLDTRQGTAGKDFEDGPA